MSFVHSHMDYALLLNGPKPVTQPPGSVAVLNHDMEPKSNDKLTPRALLSQSALDCQDYASNLGPLTSITSNGRSESTTLKLL